MKLEYFGEVSIYFGLGVQTLTALLLGGIIGYERELKSKSAGIKTNMLICIGACLYTAVSLLNQSAHGGVADPNRIAAQVVSGIGFLGAGAIIQSRGNIVGMTTAASIWVVAAIGVTIGCGFPIVATIFTGTTIVVLRLVTPIYKLIERQKDVRPFIFKILSKGTVKKYTRGIVHKHDLEIDQFWENDFNKKKNEKLLTMVVEVHPRKVDNLLNDIDRHFQVLKVSFEEYFEEEQEEDQTTSDSA